MRFPSLVCSSFVVVALMLGGASRASASSWTIGDFTTYGEAEWGSSVGTAQSLLLTDFGPVTGGIFDIGDLSIFYEEFDIGTALHTYLPQNGPVGVLNSILLDPTSSSSGAFGGDVAALQLNVEFADAGLLSGSSGILFGNLLLTGFGNAVDGLTVSQFLADANTCLGAGACLLSVTDMDALAFQLNAAFDSGTPDTFADDHLVAPTSVPEPASLLLLGTGLVATASRVRRRRSTRQLRQQ